MQYLQSPSFNALTHQIVPDRLYNATIKRQSVPDPHRGDAVKLFRKINVTYLVIIPLLSYTINLYHHKLETLLIPYLTVPDLTLTVM